MVFQYHTSQDVICCIVYIYVDSVVSGSLICEITHLCGCGCVIFILDMLQRTVITASHVAVISQ